MKPQPLRNIHTPHVGCSVTLSSHGVEAAYVAPGPEWMKRSWSHMRQEVTQSRKEDIVPFVTTWLDVERVTLSEVSQTQRGRMISLVGGL